MTAAAGEAVAVCVLVNTNRTNKTNMTDILKGIWHSIEVYEPSTIFEAKDGAYGK